MLIVEWKVIIYKFILISNYLLVQQLIGTYNRLYSRSNNTAWIKILFNTYKYLIDTKISVILFYFILF